ncbi:MAG: hypothetical protein DPW09_25850 [Anaerolineae bacterium]|nr:hypothetical protein [Anaerolineae bacterium]
MSKHLRRLIKNQPQVKVVAHTHDNSKDTVWFVTLAAAFAGVFYFFGYYFWGDLWRVLAGG